MVKRAQMSPQDEQFHSIAAARCREREQGLKAVRSVYTPPGRPYKGPRF
jgi:hypothetical protein